MADSDKNSLLEKGQNFMREVAAYVVYLAAKGEGVGNLLVQNEKLLLEGGGKPFNVAGYREGLIDLSNPRKILDAGADQSLYLWDKKDLQRAMEEARKNPAAANPGIKAFSDMIDAVGELKDTREKLEMINGWINSHVEYDKVEEANSKTNFSHRTLAGALKDGQGVCDEQARLKLLAIEELIDRKKIDLNPDDVRWVDENVYKDGKNTDTGHAVVAVRTKEGPVWILSNQADLIENGPISQSKATSSMMRNSRMETATTQVNAAGKSMFEGSNKIYIPDESFNSKTIGVFPSSDPQHLPREALDPKAVGYQDGTDEARDQAVLARLAQTAFEDRHKILPEKSAASGRQSHHYRKLTQEQAWDKPPPLDVPAYKNAQHKSQSAEAKKAKLAARSALP